MDKVIVSEESILQEISAKTTSNPNECYQCGKCSGGCPISFAMDFSPAVILRLLQAGKARTALESKAIWVCTGCGSCSTGCPMRIDIPKIMDCLKMIALRYGFLGGSQEIFHRAVVDSIYATGRMHEARVLVARKFSSGKFAGDLTRNVPLLLKGKLNIFPLKVKDRSGVRRIFSRTLGGKGEQCNE